MSFIWLKSELSQQAATESHYALQRSLQLDAWLAGTLSLIAISGSLLVKPYGWEFTTPWLVGAYIGVLLIAVLLAVQARFKWRALHGAAFQLRPYLRINMVISLILLISIKDAVTKQTWF